MTASTSVLGAQDMRRIEVYRRASGWETEVEAEALVVLHGARVPRDAMYD